MGFFRPLIIVLLLVGFASRPSVVAAMSSGYVLIQVAGETATGAYSSPEVQPLPDGEIRIAITKCISLGILPGTQILSSSPQVSSAHSLIAAEARQDHTFLFLRPPQD